MQRFLKFQGIIFESNAGDERERERERETWRKLHGQEQSNLDLFTHY
jgi:hypothetical protein